MLWYQSIGFLVIIGVLWLDQVQGLAEILFGGQPQTRDWRGSGMATLVVICIWAIVWGLTKRLVDRLHYLTGFLNICAWCQKVGHNKGQWMRLEEWFSEGFRIRTSHGMCPDCLKKMQEETAEIWRKELEPEKDSETGGGVAG